MAISSQTGFDISESDLTPTLYPHVKDTVRWAVKGGCRAIFSSFGMQKTCTQLEIERVIIEKVGGGRSDCMPQTCSRGVHHAGQAAS